jgi:hypothetical protein
VSTGPKTNNHVEGFHNRLSKKIPNVHPDIYSLINVFKSLDTATLIDIARLQNGEELPGPSKKQILKAKTYDTLLDNLKFNAIDIRTFLTAAASLISCESSGLVTVTS